MYVHRTYILDKTYILEHAYICMYKSKFMCIAYEFVIHAAFHITSTWEDLEGKTKSSMTSSMIFIAPDSFQLMKAKIS